METRQSVDRFMNKMHNYEPYAIEEGYQVLIAEYHHALCGIEDYFKQADRKLVLELVDDTSCKLLRMTTAKDAADREKCPDPRVSTENLMTGHRALNRLAALLNFKDIESADREEVCELFDSLQTTHAAIADAAGTLASLGQRLHPSQFQFLLKHSIRPLIQLQITMNFMNNAVSTPYCQGPTIQPQTAFHQKTQPEHWLQLFIITSGKECAQNLMPHRLKLPIYFKLRGKSFLHPSWDMNTTLVGNQPNQKNLKHPPPRRTHQQKNIQKNHNHLNQLQLR